MYVHIYIYIIYTYLQYTDNISFDLEFREYDSCTSAMPTPQFSMWFSRPEGSLAALVVHGQEPKAEEEDVATYG